MKDLRALLVEVDKLFETKPKKGPHPYLYYLGRFPNCWCFSVVSSWQKWTDKKLEHQFYGISPQWAVQEFLAYVTKHKINVKRLKG